MSKSIEERIDEKGVWYDSNDNCCIEYSSVVELIKEQREIDIEKACELAKTYLLVTTPQEVAEERLKRFRDALVTKFNL